MVNRVWGDEYRTTLVCVDAYRDGVPEGRFYNPYLACGQRFLSLMQFLLKMEDLLDDTQLPQSFTAARSFVPPPQRKAEAPPGEEVREGKLATFAVRVLFRQNASWQGSVTWLEGGREQSFRSVLELVLLMDGALQNKLLEQQKRVPASPSCEA